MFTPHCIEFKGFVVIGTNFLFWKSVIKIQILLATLKTNTHMCTNTVMFSISASFCKTWVMDCGFSYNFGTFLVTLGKILTL